MMVNRFPSGDQSQVTHSDYTSADSHSQVSQPSGNLGSPNQDKAQNLSRVYGTYGQSQPLNRRMYYQGVAESRLPPAENIETPAITDANLYIKNIDYDISDETLYNVFSKLGEITSHHIVRDTMKRSRGFGFMSYRTIDQAKKAIEHANGMFIGNKPVVVMLHIKKDQRRMQKLVMKETLGPSMLPRNGGAAPSYYKLQQAMHQHQSNLLNENVYRTKNSAGMGLPHSPSLALGHHSGGMFSNNGTGRSQPGRRYSNEPEFSPRQYPSKEYSQREYEAPSPESRTYSKYHYQSQDSTWDGYSADNPRSESDQYVQNKGPLVPQSSPVHPFAHVKKPPQAVDLYGPMYSLDKRQRALLPQHDMYDLMRSQEQEHGHSYQAIRSNGKSSGLWSERAGEYGQRSAAPSPSPFLQEQDPWLELGQPTSQDLNFPQTWSGGMSPRGHGQGSPTSPYESYTLSHHGKGNFSPRNSFTQREIERDSPLSSNQACMLDQLQLPEVLSRHPSPDKEREGARLQNLSPMSPSDRSFSYQGGGPGQGPGHGHGHQLGYTQFLLAEPDVQRTELAAHLLPLVEAKSSQAKKITDYLVQNAPCSELLQLLETPDLLLPHYIAAALSKLGA